jgi:hypothetical protein
MTSILGLDDRTLGLVVGMKTLTCGCLAESKTEALEGKVKWTFTLHIHGKCDRPLSAHIEEYLAWGEIK